MDFLFVRWIMVCLLDEAGGNSERAYDVINYKYCLKHLYFYS